MRVVSVLGTRPETIKLAPVIRELDGIPGVESLVVSSGQHRELNDQMLQLFGVEPQVELGVMRPAQILSELTADLVSGLSATFRDLRPDTVLVQGDTTTAFCASLAAFYEGIAVGHVEAGLRTWNLKAPYPEEANRRLIAVVADMHFCPTARSAANLAAEGVPESRLHLTGNTVIDSLLWSVEAARRLPPAIPQRRGQRVLVTLHRRESHGEPIRLVCETIAALASRSDVEVVFPVHPNPAVRKAVGGTLAGLEGVHLCEPLDYLSFVQLLDSSDLVLTDSGGVQEEAPSLGKPVLVLRETTERPEAVEGGVARVVGVAPLDVERAATALLDDPVAYAAMARAENPFGDGRAAPRIARLLCAEHGLEVAA